MDLASSKDSCLTQSVLWWLQNLIHFNHLSKIYVNYYLMTDKVYMNSKNLLLFELYEL